MHVEKSGCKVNLLLNILRRREDGFHELETVMQPIPLYDDLTFEKCSQTGIHLECSHPGVPTGAENLIFRAARAFQEASGIREGVRIRLEKNLPVAAGVGGGSGNAAATLIGLNRLFGEPLSADALVPLAADLGSDVPFFLQSGPAIAIGRGEQVDSLAPFEILQGAAILLVNPGFGVSTPWAYKNLIPEDLSSEKALAAKEFVSVAQSGDWESFIGSLYNSLERPVFAKYPVLSIIKETLIECGADGALLSGSGATVFGLVREQKNAEGIKQRFASAYGSDCWCEIVSFGKRS